MVISIYAAYGHTESQRGEDLACGIQLVKEGGRMPHSQPAGLIPCSRLQYQGEKGHDSQQQGRSHTDSCLFSLDFEMSLQKRCLVLAFICLPFST